MRINDYLKRRQEWEHHLNGGYLKSLIARATTPEKVEQIFWYQPTAHQRKYDKEHDDAEDDANAIKTFFVGCHASDIIADFQTFLRRSLSDTIHPTSAIKGTFTIRFG